ncbi:MAG: phosphoglycerate mutase [Ahniella sp.]|nr:phosphoglycerate mutase [Ahniella sp.]
MISLWLPSPKRLARVGQLESLLGTLARADRLPDAPAGLRALVSDEFVCVPGAFSEAALSRLADVGDAAHSSWLRADPVHLAADHSALRLHAYGDMGLDRAQAEDLAAVLKPLFGDLGYELSVAAPERWYLRLASGSEVPEFSPPEQVLGDRFDAHMPGGSQGLRWQRLMTEAQMSLHAHGLNRVRASQGQVPINSLWFWGGGRLPNKVTTSITRISSDDSVLAGLGKYLGRAWMADLVAALKAPGTDHDLFDLRAAFADPLLRPVLASALEQWMGGRVPVRVAFESGQRFLLKPWHRIRFWRKPPVLT